MKYIHARTIGGRGDSPGKFTGALRALAVDTTDRLYAAADSSITVLDPAGRQIRRWPTSRPPHAVAVAADGRVFVGEPEQIEVFDAAGRLDVVWRDSRRLGLVTSIGFSRGDVIAADAAARTLRRFDASGTFVNDIGANNRMHGFQIPNGVLDFDVDPSGRIYASNPGHHRVECYESDDRLLGSFGYFDGVDPSGFSGCCNPTNVALFDGNIFVTEKADPRVKVYDVAGELITVIAGLEFDPNCKNMDLAVDRSGRLYVVDTVHLDILVFELEQAR